MTHDSPPDVLTVEEAAQILRIGRNSAYGLARRWIDTGGEEGLPAIRLGRCLRVPRSALEQLLGGRLDPVEIADGEPQAVEHRQAKLAASASSSSSRGVTLGAG